MTKRFVYSNFSKLSIPNFLSKIYSIQQALSVPMFESIVPAPAEVFVVYEQMKQLAIQTTHRNYQVKGVRDALRQKLEYMLDQQCYAVNAMGCGDMSIISLSGFPVNRLRSAPSAPQKPAIKEFSITPDQTGLEIQILGCKQARQYIIEVLKKDGTMAMRHVSTRLRTVITQLPSDVELNLRVQAENSAGKSQWSPNLSFMIVESNGLSGLLQGYSQSNDKGMHAA
jgi:hypothetical protein